MRTDRIDSHQTSYWSLLELKHSRVSSDKPANKIGFMHLILNAATRSLATYFSYAYTQTKQLQPIFICTYLSQTTCLTVQEKIELSLSMIESPKASTSMCFVFSVLSKQPNS